VALGSTAVQQFVANPLAGSLAKTIGNAMKGLFLDATLLRDTASSNSPDIDPFDPPAPSTTSYSCKAIHDEYSEHDRLAGLVGQGDRKVLILAHSLSVTPINGDRITIRGRTLLITDVSTDPALAVWTCKATA